MAHMYLYTILNKFTIYEVGYERNAAAAHHNLLS
jgi:hypothetical protein